MKPNNTILGLAFLLLGTIPVQAIVIVYNDPEKKKEIEVIGADTDEGPEGITIKKGTFYEVTYTKVGMTTRRSTAPAKVTVPVKVSPVDVKDYQIGAADVGAISYPLEVRPALAMLDRAALATKDVDRQKFLKDSLPEFDRLKPKLLAGSRAKRFVDFKYAETLYRLSSMDAKDEKLRESAMAALLKYQQDHATSWQIVPALTMLAQSQDDMGDLAAVQKTYLALADTPGLSPEVRTNSLINATRALMKLEKFPDARVRLNQLKTSLPANSPMAGKVDLYLAQCELLGDNAAEAQQAEQRLRQFLGSSDDKALKALAHNTLGDYYVKAKRDEDAFWEYLRVDTLFNDDKFEHSRAMYHLIRLFREVKKDVDKAAKYEEDLTKDPRFAGLEYQKKAMKK